MLDVVSITVYDRHALLNIGSSIAQRKPDFEFLNASALFTHTASEPFVWTARQLRPRRRKRSRKIGKRAGVLVRLRRRAFRPPLPTILLANVQSLDNKLCELRARISYQRETRDCCIICLTETWMSAMFQTQPLSSRGSPCIAQETVHPDAAFVVTGDFNKANFRTIAPKYFLGSSFVGMPTNPSPIHLLANRITLLFCSCLLIGRN